ncbi:MAG TPA: hypothetical protein VFT55_09710 [Planctomycetota bacterium]|nr:hypothetical protein [Planctomycetota bacterium]
MIRGPVLPQLRDSLWSLVSRRLDAIERGLTLVVEGLDCSGGQLGQVDGLARDAMGGPVLVLLAVDGDALLSARVLSACEFLTRVGDSLVTAVPEANFCGGIGGRVLLVGTEASAASLELLRRLPLPAFQVCRLEPFRLAGTERFAVRWLSADGAASAPRLAVAPTPEFNVSKERSRDWATLRSLCERIDPGVRIDGDRFWRRITWSGRLLGEVWSVDGELRAVTADGMQSTLSGAGEIRAFADQLMRQYMKVAGVASGNASPEEGGATRSRDARLRGGSGGRSGSGKAGDESLRSSLAAARLSPEEYSALGGPAMSSGGGAAGAALADDAARIVAAQEGPWPPLRRSD